MMRGFVLFLIGVVSAFAGRWDFATPLMMVAFLLLVHDEDVRALRREMRRLRDDARADLPPDPASPARE